MDVCLPRSVAMQLAQLERDSLRTRAGSSSRPCRPLWSQAAVQADSVLRLLRARRDVAAARAALRVGPYWKQAAECEGMSYLGQAQEDAEQATFSLEDIGRQLVSLQKTSEKDLFFRKIATGAAIAGALFAAVRLTDIWLAVKRRQREA